MFLTIGDHSNGIHDVEECRIVLKGVGQGKPEKSNLKNDALVSIESTLSVHIFVCVWIRPLYFELVIFAVYLVQIDLNAVMNIGYVEVDR